MSEYAQFNLCWLFVTAIACWCAWLAGRDKGVNDAHRRSLDELRREVLEYDFGDTDE